MNIKNTKCGKCGSSDPKGYIGTSRSDNTTILCPSCDQKEALDEWEEERGEQIIQDIAGKMEVEKMKTKCVVCGINWVNAWEGHDTCEQCINKV
jgi:hypothetical protein